MVRVEYVLEHWAAVRRDAAQAVREWPESEREFRAAPAMMSFGALAWHVAEAGHVMTGILLSGETDYQREGFRESNQRHLPALDKNISLAALADAMESLAAERSAELATHGPEWWAEMVRKWSGERMTRLEFLTFVVEHELTHRSQMFVCMRLKGMTPPTTRRMQAAK